MRRVAMARKDHNPMPSLLQTNSSVDNQALGAPNAQVGVQKDYRLLFRVAGHGDGVDPGMVGC